MRDPVLRRLVAAEAHRRRTGRLPPALHSLGTGESFVVEETAAGLRDAETGAEAARAGDSLLLGEGGAEIALEGDVAFRGRDLSTGEWFTGRVGGGASVTIYDARGDFFQYAVAGGGVA